MFIREKETKNKHTGRTYKKHVLVETVRTVKGPRQRTVMQLGTLELPRSKWKALAACLERKLSGQTTFVEESPEIEATASSAMEQYEVVARKKEERTKRETEQNLVTVDLNTTATTQNRSLGAELVVDKIWKQLDVNNILKNHGFTGTERALAEAVVAARLIEPGSDLDTWRWLHQRSAIKEILAVNLDGIGKDSVYEIADRLLFHKKELEKALYKEVCKTVGDGNTVYIYDLTNTYFEGPCKSNDMAKHGKSKEKRSDCLLVSLALVVDRNGFPVFSQIYRGNQSEPETLEHILTRLEEDSPPLLQYSKPTLIMDRGIATSENIKYLEEKGYPYVVIERRSAEKDYLQEYENNLDTFSKIHPEENREEEAVYVKKITAGDKSKVLCLSRRKEAKEVSIDHLKEKRFLEDLQRLHRSLQKGRIKRKEKVWERIGRIRERYPTIAQYYDISTRTDGEEKDVVDLKWLKKDTRQNRQTLTGCYVIETTHQEMSAIEIWKLYMTVLRVESAFKTIKSDLGLRPVHHQLAKRTEGHLFISVLAYLILSSIEYQLQKKGDHSKWSTICKELSTHDRTTVILTDEHDQIHHIRVSGTPEKRHQEIYEKLDVPMLQKRRHSCVASRM